MPIRFDTRNQRWRFEFDQVIAGQRQRASRLLPKGYTKAEAQKFDLEETKRLHAVAAGVSKPEPLIEDAVLLYLKHHAPALKSFDNIVRELKACYEAYAGKPFSALPAIALSYKPVDDSKKPMAAATVRNRLSYLRAACRYAWKHHGLGDSNPQSVSACPRCVMSGTSTLGARNSWPSAAESNRAKLGLRSGLRSTAACVQQKWDKPRYTLEAMCSSWTASTPRTVCRAWCQFITELLTLCATHRCGQCSQPSGP